MGRKSWIFVVPLIVLGLFIVGVATFVVLEKRALQEKASVSIGQKILPLLMLTGEGMNRDLSQKISENAKEHKKTILVFWATWCEPCLRELPLIKKNLDRSEQENLRYIFINYDEGNPQEVLKEVNAWLIAQGLQQFPIYFDFKQELMAMLGVSALPYSVGIGVNEKIAWVHVGELDFSKTNIFNQP